MNVVDCRRRYGKMQAKYDSEICYLESSRITSDSDPRPQIDLGITFDNYLSCDIICYVQNAINAEHGNYSILGYKYPTGSSIVYTDGFLNNLGISNNTSNPLNPSTGCIRYKVVTDNNYNCNSYLYLNNTLIKSVSGTATGSTNINNLYLCNCYNDAYTKAPLSRLYSAKFYYLETLILDLIPVKIGNIGCLYDIVNKNILYSSGGNFICGPDKLFRRGVITFNKHDNCALNSDGIINTNIAHWELCAIRLQPGETCVIKLRWNNNHYVRIGYTTTSIFDIYTTSVTLLVNTPSGGNYYEYSYTADSYTWIVWQNSILDETINTLEIL